MEGLYESLTIENNASTSNNNQMIDSNENFSVSLFSEDELAPAYGSYYLKNSLSLLLKYISNQK